MSQPPPQGSVPDTPAATPVKSRAWIGWILAGLAVLGGAYGIYGGDGLKMVALTVAGIGLFIGYTYVVGSAATKLFGPGKRADNVVLVAVILAFVALMYPAWRDSSERNARVKAAEEAAKVAPKAK